MKSYGSRVMCSLAGLFCCAACGGGGGSGTADGGSGTADGGSSADPVSIMVSVSGVTYWNKPTSVAYRDGEGPWTIVPDDLKSSAYYFPNRLLSWDFAFVCANPDDTKVSVHILHGRRSPLATGTQSESLDVGDDCVPVSNPPRQLTVNLKNAPPTTTRFGFTQVNNYFNVMSYPDETSIAPVGGTAKASLSWLVGTDSDQTKWGLLFIARDAENLPPTRIAVAPHRAYAGDTTLEVDLSDARAFVPVPHSIIIKGLAAGDTATGRFLIGNSKSGALISTPLTVAAPTASTTYAVAPDDVVKRLGIEAPRYFGDYSVTTADGTSTRSVRLSVEQSAPDIEVELPAALEGVDVVAASREKTLRVTTTVLITREETFDPIEITTTTQASTGTTRYLEHFLALSRISLTSGDDPFKPGSFATTTPDLTSLPFWKPAWNLAVNGKAVTEVTATRITKGLTAKGKRVGSVEPRATRRITTLP